MRGQEVSEEPFQARFPELAAQMRKLKQIVEIVDRVAEGAHFAELLFRILQVLLHSFELRKALFNVLIELHLHLLCDRHQLLVHAIANRVEALRGLLIQALKFDLELLGSEQQRTGHLAAPVAQTPVLFFSSRGKLLLDRAPNLRKALLDAVCDLLAQVPLSLLQPAGHIGSGGTELLAEAGAKTFEQARNLPFFIHFPGSPNAGQPNSPEPHEDKSSDQDSHQ